MGFTPYEFTKDADGWSIIEPVTSGVNESRLFYVSDTDGSDGTGAYELAGDLLGTHPEDHTPSTPWKTISAAMTAMKLRSGYPDWLLFKRGDSWYKQQFSQGALIGLDSANPAVVTSYGSISVDRPDIYPTPPNHGFDFQGCKYFVFRSVHLNFRDRNPDDSEWGGSGTSCTALRSIGFTPEYMLIEDCMFSWPEHGIEIDAALSTFSTNIAVRRNVFNNNWQNPGIPGQQYNHSQGFFFKESKGVLAEENIFWHNGWLDHVSAPGYADERAIYSHGIYSQEDNEDGFIIRDNLFLWCEDSGVQARAGADFYRNLTARCSSVGFLQRPGGLATFATEDVLFDDNVMCEAQNPTGIYLTEFGGRQNLLKIEPTSFRSGQTVYFRRNIMCSNDPSIWIANGQALKLDGSFGSGTVYYALDNVIFNSCIGIYTPTIPGSGGPFSFQNNNVSVWESESPKNPNHIVWWSDADELSAAEFSGQYYTGGRDTTCNFYVYDSTSMDCKSYSEWLTYSGETGSSYSSTYAGSGLNYTDPYRTVGTYYYEKILENSPEAAPKSTTLHNDSYFAAFGAQIIQQRRGYWRLSYDNITLINYFREGFDMDLLEGGNGNGGTPDAAVQPVPASSDYTVFLEF